MSSEASNTETPPEAPKSMLEKLGAGLPVALTLIATTFAGMSTSELQEAMFWRSYAAQDQAKASSQWSYAGFKRDRALICETTAAHMRIAAQGQSLTLANQSALKGSEGPEDAAKRAKLETEAAQWLQGAGPPRLNMPEVTDENLIKLMDAIRNRQPERDTLKLAGKVPQKVINSSIDDAEKWADETDKAWDPTIKAALRMTEASLKEKTADPKAVAAVQAARYELEQRRYRAESTYNQNIGFLYEARVKVSTAESDKHRQKSQNFFFAMLAAQVGATVASLALARKQKSALWLLAGLAGLISIAVGLVVFLM